MFLVIGTVMIFFGCSADNPIAPESDQSDQTLISLAKKHATFYGTSEIDHVQDWGTMTPLPNGKALGRGYISVYYDDVSDPRVKGFSTWYITIARLEADGSAKFNGKAELIVDDDGGRWEMTWHGRKAADGSIVDYVVGTGKEGAVKGLVAKWTYTRPVGMPGFYNVKGYIVER